MVCSCAWTLLNRGSKYWQESWETKVGERFEPGVTGKLFSEEEPIQEQKGCWLRARKFSVSKLAIALSDYVFLLWLSLVVTEIVRKYAPDLHWNTQELWSCTVCSALVCLRTAVGRIWPEESTAMKHANKADCFSGSLAASPLGGSLSASLGHKNPRCAWFLVEKELIRVPALLASPILNRSLVSLPIPRP